MKKLTYIIAGLAFLLSSCAKENEFVDIYNREIGPDNDNADAYSSRANIHTHAQQCVRVTASHWLSGSCIDQPVREVARESSMGRTPARRYVIEASGNAVSEVYARGLSKVSLVYNTGTRRVTGVMKTNFHYGEIMEVKFDAIARLRHDGQSIRLKVNISESLFLTEFEKINFPKGEITLVIPSEPQGQFAMQIYSDIGL